MIRSTKGPSRKDRAPLGGLGKPIRCGRRSATGLYASKARLRECAQLGSEKKFIATAGVGQAELGQVLGSSLNVKLRFPRRLRIVDSVVNPQSINPQSEIE
jgi:hypothetical protein